MGIKGIYNEIGPGERIALSKLAVQTYEEENRPLRLAIDISIWLFQIQSGKGGTNPALRTFYYRLLRLISLSIHPLFVFDGPNKPPFKRNKRTGPNVASIPEFLAKQLLKQFGIPFHIAPGEAEAECALLQQQGIVDAVLSEDVDTLMFGSRLTLRNWSPENRAKGPVTHVNLYDAAKTKAGPSGLDRQGMILVAIMSGGDYIPEGVPGCGPKLACEAARAGFGEDLCNLGRNDTRGVAEWKERLCHELKTNESKYFRSKHKALVIPEDFPRLDILKYYTHPCVSSLEKIASLRASLRWDLDIDIAALRTFVGEAFDWTCVSGAKKFIRNLAPALLIKTLRLRADSNQDGCDDTDQIAADEATLIKSIHRSRNHATTDGLTELRVSFVPHSLVDIDLDAEEPDPEQPMDPTESDEEEVVITEEKDAQAEPQSPRKLRPMYAYDPTQTEKIWLLETYIKVGVPLKWEDWEETCRKTRDLAAAKTQKQISKISGGMAKGALDPYARVTKPFAASSQPPSTRDKIVSVLEKTESQQATAEESRGNLGKPFKLPAQLPPTPPKPARERVIEIVSSPENGTSAPNPKARPFRRFHSDTPMAKSNAANNLNEDDEQPDQDRPTHFLLQSIPELPNSVTTRRLRSPLRRVQSTSNGEEATTSTKSMDAFSKFQVPHRPASSPQIAESNRSNAAPKRKERPASNQPSTPNSKRSQQRPSEVITISSSPQAPSPSQKFMANFLQTQPPTSPSPKRVVNRFIDTEKPSEAQSGRPESTKFRLPLEGLTDDATNMTAREEDEEPVKFRSEQRRLRKSHTGLQVTKLGASHGGGVLRVRESLEGAWKADEVEVENRTQPTNLSRNGRGRGQERRWRVSQVEVLDLTEV